VRVSIEEGLADAGWVRHVYLRLVKLLYRRADLVVPVSHALAEQLQRLYGVPAEKMRVIYNLYDLDRIRDMAREPLPSEMAAVYEKPVVVNVGSLVAQKGQEHLLRAFAIARRSEPNLQLVIVGRGEIETSLRALAAAQGVEQCVHFTGFDANPYRYLGPARMFVLSSRFEGFPNVLAEAMACGLPVIATDCKTGPREILGDSQHGILLPDVVAGDASAVEQQMAAAMLRLLEPACAAHFAAAALARSADFSQERLIGEWVSAVM
jgi:glycosyltransferase involved in cell wall biosynthesis